MEKLRMFRRRKNRKRGRISLGGGKRGFLSSKRGIYPLVDSALRPGRITREGCRWGRIFVTSISRYLIDKECENLIFEAVSRAYQQLFPKLGPVDSFGGGLSYPVIHEAYYLFISFYIFIL